MESLRVKVPTELEKEVLEAYGNPVTDNYGHLFEYTEQDIYKQVRKRLRLYERNQ